MTLMCASQTPRFLVLVQYWLKCNDASWPKDNELTTNMKKLTIVAGGDPHCDSAGCIEELFSSALCINHWLWSHWIKFLYPTSSPPPLSLWKLSKMTKSRSFPKRLVCPMNIGEMRSAMQRKTRRNFFRVLNCNTSRRRRTKSNFSWGKFWSAIHCTDQRHIKLTNLIAFLCWWRSHS